MRCKKELSPIDRYNADFPSNLRNLLREKKVTQQELAEAIGKSRPVVGLYANGVASPDIETLVKIARYFSVSTDYLLGRSKYERPETSNLSVEDVGLSEKATKRLIALSQLQGADQQLKIQVINKLLEEDSYNSDATLTSFSKYLFVCADSSLFFKISNDGSVQSSKEAGFNMDDTTVFASNADDLFGEMFLRTLQLHLSNLRHTIIEEKLQAGENSKGGQKNGIPKTEND